MGGEVPSDFAPIGTTTGVISRGGSEIDEEVDTAVSLPFLARLLVGGLA
jgi:hypothetical protein